MKIQLPNKLDPNHKYSHKSGEYGSHFQYWYLDKRSGNYWKYSNAPEGTIDYVVSKGEPILDPEQTFLHQNPEFFTPEGFRRNMAPPSGVEVLSNENYNPFDFSNIYKEYYLSPDGEGLRYIYLDKDCKEDLDLYIQSQIRICDAGLTKYRKFAANKFKSSYDRDKAVGCILMLVDQAFFDVKSVISAKVDDMALIDDTVILLGRKMRVDPPLLDYLSSRIIGRDVESPLFSQNTLNGEEPFYESTIQAYFAYLKVSSTFLPYWHATHTYSKIVNKYALLSVPPDEVESMAFNELAKVMSTEVNVRYMVDPQVVNTLSRAYNSGIKKSLLVASSDQYGVVQVWSDLVDRKGDELSFSTWLHSMPMHAQYEGELEEQEAELATDIEEDNKTYEEQVKEKESEVDTENTVIRAEGYDDNV